MIWLANRAQNSGLQILLSANKIDHTIVDRVEEQTIDREIAALGVLLGGGEAHANRVASVFILHIRAKRRDFDLAAAQAHEDHPKRGADGLRVVEEFSHALGRRVSRNVVVFWIQP